MALGRRGPMAVPPSWLAAAVVGHGGAGKGTRRRGRKQHPETVSGKREFISFSLNQGLTEPC